MPSDSPDRLELHYLANVRMPTEKAHGLQIMQNCEALAAHADVTLYPARRRQPPDLRGADPWTFYAVPPVFRLNYVPTLDLIALVPGRTDRLAQAFFYGQTVSYFAALLWKLRRAGPDAVYYSRGHLLLAALRRFRPARRLFWEVHSLSENPRKRAAQAALARRVGGVIPVTHALAERLIDFGVDPARVHVAPDGIRAARFADMPGQAEARRALGLPEDAFIVGYMGRLHTLNMSKGVDVLIEAMGRVGARPLHLLLVGGPEVMAEQLRRQWIALGLPEDRFHALGQLPAAEVPRALAAFDVAAMPFPWTEHFAYYASAIKLFEYMASGRAILATDLPSTAEIVTDGETALLVPPSEVGPMAAALLRLYDDPVLRARLGHAARELVFAQYTWAARAAAIAAFVRDRKA